MHIVNGVFIVNCVCIVHCVCTGHGVCIVGDLELSYYSAILIGLRQAPDLYAIFSAYFCLLTKC